MALWWVLPTAGSRYNLPMSVPTTIVLLRRFADQLIAEAPPLQWLSPQELGEWLGVPPSQLYAWRRRGLGPPFYTNGVPSSLRGERVPRGRPPAVVYNTRRTISWLLGERELRDGRWTRLVARPRRVWLEDGRWLTSTD